MMTDSDTVQHHTVHFSAAGKEQPSSQYVYLSNLPVDAYEGTIRQAFEKEGIKVAAIKLLQKGSFNRRRNAGLATVRLLSAADAQRCCELLNGKMLHAGADTAHGRPLIVSCKKFECSSFEQQQVDDSCDDS